jgi:3-oxoacyl-[acyl-carrier-protein] synthase-1
MKERVVYIGAESCVTPLGNTVGTNFQSLLNGVSGIKLQPEVGFQQQAFPLSAFPTGTYRLPFEELVMESVANSLAGVDQKIVESERTILLISSTKGELALSVASPFISTVRHLTGKYLLKNEPLVVSSACISGVSALNMASRYLSAGYYDHAIVVGCDVLSDFVIYGFQSLFALSSECCRPFDKDRAGVNLGEGSAAVVLSVNKTIFKESSLELLGGAISNDANHISGPSRTGEGLYRCVKKTLDKHGLNNDDLGFISAHGTATLYNDEMESIAFSRLGLAGVPLNSFKGYIGHTLGAAGIIEVVFSMQSLRSQILIKSLGFDNQGTTGDIRVIKNNTTSHFSVVLKTASGFGGCNSSLLLRKI